MFPLYTCNAQLLYDRSRMHYAYIDINAQNGTYNILTCLVWSNIHIYLDMSTDTNMQWNQEHPKMSLWHLRISLYSHERPQHLDVFMTGISNVLYTISPVFKWSWYWPATAASTAHAREDIPSMRWIDSDDMVPWYVTLMGHRGIPCWRGYGPLGCAQCWRRYAPVIRRVRLCTTRPMVDFHVYYGVSLR